MKYIQCPHCSKKYAVNDRVSAAVGKNIRCKDCKQSFEIIILDSVDQIQASDEKKDMGGVQAESGSQITSTPESKTSDQAARPDTANKSKPSGKQLNYQFLILITLLSLLGIAIIIGIASYVYPDLFKSFIAQPKQSEKKHRQSNLLSIEAAHMKRIAASTDGKRKQEPSQPEKTSPPDKSLLEGPENPAQDCKNAAASQWISDRVLIAGEIPPDMYTKLLNQSLSITANVRTLCKDKFLVGRITEAAKINAKPEWIKEEIEASLIIR